MISCPLCLKPHFQGVDSLRSSLISVATSQLKCPVCTESLLGLDKLTIHLFSHIAENEAPSDFKCDICSFTFADRAILDMHQKLLHQTQPNAGLYSYHCHLCSKKFKKRGSLMVHLRVAHYGFQQADDKMEASNSQAKHDNKQWECDVCSKMFTTKYFLKKHKRLHTGEMPYFCALCNKSFTFQQSYHKHMLYHSSEKPHVCTECGRAFKELSTLQNHFRIHSGERPFGCETCGKRFRQRVSYLVHQRIHTGVMPYKCTACNKSFRYKVSQRSHKCPVNPPGSVIKVSEKQEVGEGIKCIMSVDYNTGNINFIQNERDDGIKVTYVGGGEAGKELQELVDMDGRIGQQEKSSDDVDLCQNVRDASPVYATDQPDLFSMVLSPLLPDVESLCLSNTENSSKSNDKSCEGLQMINEESLKELLYGPDSKLQ